MKARDGYCRQQATSPCRSQHYRDQMVACKMPIGAAEQSQVPFSGLDFIVVLG
jgi:hypothetical protein